MESKPNSWKKVQTVSTQKNPFYSFVEDEVITPQGKTGKYFYIDHQLAVMIIAEDANGNVYLVGQYRYPIGNVFSWEFVSGGVLADEAPLDAAKRELQEELGITAAEWVDLGYCYPINGYSSEQICIYLAKGLQFGAVSFDETEDLVTKKVTQSELRDMIRNGEITCGETLAAYQKYCSFHVD